MSTETVLTLTLVAIYYALGYLMMILYGKARYLKLYFVTLEHYVTIDINIKTSLKKY